MDTAEELRAESRRPLGHRAAGGSLPFSPPPPTRIGETPWLEPYPDALLDELPDPAPGPEVRYEQREAIGLAFII